MALPEIAPIIRPQAVLDRVFFSGKGCRENLPWVQQEIKTEFPDWAFRRESRQG